MPNYALEATLGGVVCGIDEVGRGALAGDVYAAAVILDAENIPLGINDSKKLSMARRLELARLICASSHVGVGMATVAEIDAINILQATMLAMQRAFHALPSTPAFALVDGNRAPLLPCATYCIVKGDSKSLSIAAASIVAKVSRDVAMHELHEAHPHYGFDRHVGYGTKAHLQALGIHGATSHHRFSFRPVKHLCVC